MLDPVMQFTTIKEYGYRYLHSITLDNNVLNQYLLIIIIMALLFLIDLKKQ